jgi:hypothetical protein
MLWQVAEYEKSPQYDGVVTKSVKLLSSTAGSPMK